MQNIVAFLFTEKFDELKKKFGDLCTENFDLKRKNALFRQNHKFSVEKQEQKNSEFKSRLIKVEQGFPSKNTGFHPEQPQDVPPAPPERSERVEVSAVDAPDSVIDASEDCKNQSNNASSSVKNGGLVILNRWSMVYQNSHRKKGAENFVQSITDQLKKDKIQSSNKTISCDEISAKAPCQNSFTVPLLSLAQLFDKATDAECGAIDVNQEEILR
jgi:hypothetical protein